MESIETWHAEHIELPRVRGSVRALRARLPLADVRAAAARAGAQAGSRRAARLGRGLGSDERGAGLGAAGVGDAGLRVPARVPADVRRWASNGLASGNHLLEAIVHGLCEVIERDAEARWRLQRGQRRVDLDTVTRPALPGAAGSDRRRAGAHDRLGHHLATSGVPAYGCAIMEDPREPAWRALGLYQGFGCHLDAPVALARALSEAVQTRVSYISGSRDDFFPHDYARTTDEPLLRQIWDELELPPAESVDFAGAPRLAGADLRGTTLRLLLDRLRADGQRARCWWSSCPGRELGDPGGEAAGARVRADSERSDTAWARPWAPARSTATVVFLGPTLPLDEARALLPRARVPAPRGHGYGRRLPAGAACGQALASAHRHHRRAVRAGARGLARGDPVRDGARGGGVGGGQHGGVARG